MGWVVAVSRSASGRLRSLADCRGLSGVRSGKRRIQGDRQCLEPDGGNVSKTTGTRVPQEAAEVAEWFRDHGCRSERLSRHGLRRGGIQLGRLPAKITELSVGYRW